MFLRHAFNSHLVLQSSVFINLFVVGVFAHGFYDRDSAPEEIGLENAGKYLGEVRAAG
jgi:hypothetical protein